MNQRGEQWVVIQILLQVAVFLAPPDGRGRFPGWVRPFGLLLMGLGALLGIASSRVLGRSLTVFPKPTEQGELARTGTYRLVRHPIYLALLLLSLGWSLWRSSVSGLGMNALLFAFYDAKSRQEEEWLIERYPKYASYRQQVKRLIPTLY